MGGNSTAWMNTAVLVTCMRNFPKNRGPVSGILKGYVGLSTAIFTDICSALFSSDPSAFLLMLTIIPAVVCLICALFLHPAPPAARDHERDRETRFLNVVNAIAVIMAAYLLAFDLSGDHHNRVVSLAFAVGLVALLAMPLVIPFYLIITKPEVHSDIEQETMKQPLLLDQEASAARKEEPEVVLEVKRKPLIGEDHTIVEMVQTVDFWVLFMSFLCGVGTGMCMMNNMGQMGPALGYSNVSIFVSLTSIWGFFGRIVSGLVSEHYIW